MLNTAFIQSRRDALGLTQEQAAKAAGLGTRTHWHRIESGKRANIEIATLLRISRVLKCSAAELLTEPDGERIVRAHCTKPAKAKKTQQTRGKSARRRGD